MKQNLNFTEINKLIKALTDIDEYLDMIYSGRHAQEERIRYLCVHILRKDAERSLAEVSAPELKKSKAGIRVSALIEAGYDNLYKLSCAKDWELLAVQGIGEKQSEFDTYADRSVMAEATDNLLDREWIRQFIDKEREKYLPMVV